MGNKLILVSHGQSVYYLENRFTAGNIKKDLYKDLNVCSWQQFKSFDYVF